MEFILRPSQDPVGDREPFICRARQLLRESPLIGN